MQNICVPLAHSMKCFLDENEKEKYPMVESSNGLSNIQPNANPSQLLLCMHYSTIIRKKNCKHRSTSKFNKAITRWEPS